ncbi:uncharacterized protein BDW47DRAFT_100636 [Aspergillus candidus]|uniref:Uncharacterized protein n=1 Tax=Aspergillus candidus TaxID=41067 RepID=A0A2I2FJ62_ASPCN|nr:hypothetical protein BDW47DRAFT_100636 [Aspergillus candidus]PLB40677.1 hypothetical protein BDW47DRAFT_100636 [Aspergillus candidus]
MHFMRLVSPKSQRQGEERLRKEGQQGKSTRQNPRDSRFMRVEHGIYLLDVVQGATRAMAVAHRTKPIGRKSPGWAALHRQGNQADTPFRRSLEGYSLFFLFFFFPLCPFPFLCR